MVSNKLMYFTFNFVVALLIINRYDPIPQSGKSKGLVLVLDAHTDLVTGSSISSDFEVQKHYTMCWIIIKLLLFCRGLKL